MYWPVYPIGELREENERRLNVQRKEVPPTNIHDANAESIDSNVSIWNEKIKEQHAGFAGEIAAENAVIEISSDYAAKLEESDYPTEACLTPDEVLDFLEGDTFADRRQHVNSCRGCQVLVETTKQSGAAAGALLDDVRSLINPADSVRTEVYSGIRERRHLTFRHFAEEFGFSLFPSALLYFAYFAYSIRNGHRPSPSTVIGLVLSLLGAALLFRAIYPRRSWYLYGGTLAGGLVFALAMVGIFHVNSRKIESQRAVVKSLAKENAEDFALDSMAFHQKAGKYLQGSDSEPLRVKVSRASKDQVSYIATTKSVPGQIVIDLNASQGTLAWQNASSSATKDVAVWARLFAGRVIRSDTNETLIMLSDKRKIAISGNTDVSSLPPKTSVFVSLDSKDSIRRVLSPDVGASVKTSSLGINPDLAARERQRD